MLERRPEEEGIKTKLEEGREPWENLDYERKLDPKDLSNLLKAGGTTHRRLLSLTLENPQ